MPSIGTIIPLASGAVRRERGERPASVQAPASAGSSDTRWTSRPDDSASAREAAILRNLSQGARSASLEARIAGTLAPPRPGHRASARASGDPAPAAARVEGLARLEVLGSVTFASLDAPLGAAAAGSFHLNGARVDVRATDTLASLRDRINSLPTGARGSGVRAATVGGVAGGHRLALFNEVAGSGEIELVDGSTGGPLARLGIVEREMLPNRDVKGDAASGRFSSVKSAIASLLGVVTYPPPATMKVNGRTVIVDLEVDSLSAIAARVFAEARTNAAIEEEEIAGSTLYRLVVDGQVEPATKDDELVASMVGFVRARRPSLPALQPRPTPGQDAPWILADPASEAWSGGDAVGLAPRAAGRAAQAAMLERFTALDAVMSRVREQAMPLAHEIRDLAPPSQGR